VIKLWPVVAPAAPPAITPAAIATALLARREQVQDRHSRRKTAVTPAYRLIQLDF